MSTTLRAVLEDARARGYLGPGEVDAHIEHAHGFARALRHAPVLFADLGSGGGIPGLVLATRWRDAAGLLIDSSTKRASFLRDAVAALDLQDRIDVAAEPAEEVARRSDWRGRFPVVVARSFGPPAVVAECAAPLLCPDGHLVVSEPPDASTSGERWPAAPLRTIGLVSLERTPGTPAYQVLARAGECPARYPRRVGIPRKRPLF